MSAEMELDEICLLPFRKPMGLFVFLAVKGVDDPFAETVSNEKCSIPLCNGGGGVVHGGPKSCMCALVTPAVQNVLMSMIGSIITGVWHFVYRAK